MPWGIPMSATPTDNEFEEFEEQFNSALDEVDDDDLFMMEPSVTSVS